MKKKINYQNLIIAHRGVHDNKKTPENSLSAFKKAIELKLPIELDIQLTKDNQLIVFHDKDLVRMTDSHNCVKDLTLEEIKKLKLLNTKEKIPTLKEVLELINSKVLIDIEIKNTEKINEISNTLLEELKDYKGNFIIKSFNPNIIKYLKKQKPSYTYGILISDKQPNKLKKFLSTSNLLLQYYKPDFISISKYLINNKNFKKFGKDHPILIWSINSKEELKKYHYQDYSYICNNLPYKKN